MTIIAFKTTNASEKPPHEAMFCTPPTEYNPPQQSSFMSLQTAIKTCKECYSVCVVVIFTLIFIISLLLLAFKPSQEVVNVVLFDEKRAPLFVTNSKFLSVALDSSVIAESFRNFNMTDPRLEKLLAALAPGYFRVGGTMADRLLFTPKNAPIFKTQSVLNMDGDDCAYENAHCDVTVRPNFTMSGDEWLALNRLVAKSGFTLLFDLNCLTRFENGSWDFANAESLIEFSDRHNLSVIWELGNEPDAFRHVFNYEVNATQLGRDFGVLKKLLVKYPRYKNALLVGPDTTRPKPEHQESVKYLKEFLGVAGNVVDAITWHQYYLNGRTASGLDFIDPEVFNLLQSQIDDVKQIVAQAGLEKKPIWLGETSSAYGGGAPRYSNTYVSTFIWLDKLGLAAKNGLDLIIRQSFFKGNYALLYDDYSPAPDFWVSVLYKKLVGPQVVPCYKMISERVRVYCHCAKDAFYGNNNNDTAAVVVFAMNMKERRAKIRLQGLADNEETDNQNVFAYVIQTEYSLLSRMVLLNDRFLTLTSDGGLPTFVPEIVAAQPYLVLPAYSLAFWVVPAPALKYCAK